MVAGEDVSMEVCRTEGCTGSVYSGTSSRSWPRAKRAQGQYLYLDKCRSHRQYSMCNTLVARKGADASMQTVRGDEGCQQLGSPRTACESCCCCCHFSVMQGLLMPACYSNAECCAEGLYAAAQRRVVMQDPQELMVLVPLLLLLLPQLLLPLLLPMPLLAATASPATCALLMLPVLLLALLLLLTVNSGSTCCTASRSTHKAAPPNAAAAAAGAAATNQRDYLLLLTLRAGSTCCTGSRSAHQAPGSGSHWGRWSAGQSSTMMSNCERKAQARQHQCAYECIMTGQRLSLGSMVCRPQRPSSTGTQMYV
jgi:hypothetical protein